MSTPAATTTSTIITTMRLSVFLIVLLALNAPPSLRSQERPRPLPAFDVMEKSIEDLQKAMQDKQVTSRELVELYLARIGAYDQLGPALNAVVAINPQARDEAATLDAELPGTDAVARRRIHAISCACSRTGGGCRGLRT